MHDGRPAAGQATASEHAPWSLQRRLVAGILALLAATSVIVGTLSVAALHSTLIGRVDSQLDEAARYAQQLAPDVGNLLRGQGTGAIGLLVVGSEIVGGRYIGPGGEPRTLTAGQERSLLTARPGRPPVTVELGAQFGTYRLIAVQGGGDSELIIGLPLDDVQATTGIVGAVVAIVVVLALVLAAVAGRGVVRLALGPLDRVVALATRVARTPLAVGEVSLPERVPDAHASTEVAQVGAAVNRMLDHIDSALAERQANQERMQRFVADASHELRTPLAAIRGYAELTRRSGHELPEDVAHSLRRIESESIRMSSLVEELLLLARLDESREVADELVEVTGLVEDAVSDARAASGDHEWVVDVPPEPVVVRGEQHRLHQLVANLLANASAHTPAGTRVRAVVREEGGKVVVRVEDDGPGIPEELLPTLFERFVRGERSRSRQTGGAGLGLAIVKAIAIAHGGEVGVESGPGRTVFRVELPALPPTG